MWSPCGVHLESMGKGKVLMMHDRPAKILVSATSQTINKNNKNTWGTNNETLFRHLAPLVLHPSPLSRSTCFSPVWAPLPQHGPFPVVNKYVEPIKN